MSNLFDQFDAPAAAPAAAPLATNPFDQFDPNAKPVAQAQATPAPNPELAKQWANAGSGERLQMLMSRFLPTAKKVVPPIAKNMAAQGIETVGAAGGAALGGLTSPVTGPVGPMAGGATGDLAAQNLNKYLGLQNGIDYGRVAASGIFPAAKGPITAPLAAAAGTQVQSLIDTGKPAGVAETALAAAAGRMGAGETVPIEQSVKDATIKEGQAIGYVLPPNEVNPNGATKLVGSIAGKADQRVNSIKINQQVTNATAAKAIGLDPADAAKNGISPQAINQAKAVQNQTYAKVASLSPDAAFALDQFKQANSDAKLYYKAYAASSADPSKLKQAQEFESQAEQWNDVLADEAKKAGQPQLAQEFTQARTNLAKIHTVDAALNDATGNVSAPVIGRMFDKGKPLTDGLDTIGKFNQAFPNYTGEADRFAGTGVSKLIPTEMAAGAAAGGHFFGVPGAIVGGAAPLVRPSVGHFALSPTGQRVLATPPSSHILTPTIAANLARFSGMPAAEEISDAPLTPAEQQRLLELQLQAQQK